MSNIQTDKTIEGTQGNFLLPIYFLLSY